MVHAILFITDSYIRTQQMQDRLQRYGVAAEIANFSNPGLDAIPRRLPTVIVLDVQAFDCNTYLLCQMLKTNSITHTIPIIVLTSLYNMREVLKVLDAGAHDCIPNDIFAVQNLLETLRCLKGVPAHNPFINSLDSAAPPQTNSISQSPIL